MSAKRPCTVGGQIIKMLRFVPKDQTTYLIEDQIMKKLVCSDACSTSTRGTLVCSAVSTMIVQSSKNFGNDGL